MAFGVAVAAPPPNDDCANATVVTAFDFGDSVDTTDATTESTDPLLACTKGGPAQNGHSVWYAYTPATSGFLFIGTLGTPYDTVVAIHTGSCGSLTTVACKDDSLVGTTGNVGVRADAGTAYLLESTAFGSDPGGPGHVTVSFEPDSPACPLPSPAGATAMRLTFARLGPPLGDERLSVRGEITVTALPDLSTTGLQLRLDDPDAQYQPLYDLSSATIAVPPGGPGTGCDPRDGWTLRKGAFKYKNLSNAFPPCVPGSANGLRSLRIQLDQKTFLTRVRATIRGGSIVEPALSFFDDVRLSMGFAADPVTSQQFECINDRIPCSTPSRGRLRCER